MARYILTLTLGTSERGLFLVLMEKMQSIVNDCDPEDVDYELGQGAQKQ